MKSVAILAILSVCVACGGGSASDGVTSNPEKNRIRMQVGGTSCSGNVLWFINGTGNGPYGDNVTIPWSRTQSGASGDAIELHACNLCTIACDNPPCSATVIASIYWEGKLLTTQTNSEVNQPYCNAPVTVQATIP